MKKQYSGRITRAVDGDTLDIMLDLGFDVYYQARIRVHGINTQELRDKNPDNKLLAEQAKKEAKKFEGKEGDITIVGKDRYGRWVTDISVGGIDYGKYMVEKGLADVALYAERDAVFEYELA